jgi:hypothetical protein
MTSCCPDADAGVEDAIGTADLETTRWPPMEDWVTAAILGLGMACC